VPTAATKTLSLLRRLLRCERGFVLPATLGVSTVLAIVGTTALTYSTSSARTASRSSADKKAYALAEAGINDALAVLNLPSNNPMLQRTLPACTTNNTKYSNPAAQRTSVSTWSQASLSTGSVAWCGTYVDSSNAWYLAAIGTTRDPNREANTLGSTLEARVTVTPTVVQPIGNPVWNYVYAGRTGNVCDQTLNNNVNGSSRMYVAGNLCIGNNANVMQTSITVGGNLALSGGNTAVGTNSVVSTRVETEVGGTCSFGTGTPVTCTGNQDALKIYSKLKDANGDWAVGVNHTPRVIPPPTASFSTWYQNAIPGPAQSCTFSTGPVPTFDTNYPSMDNSVTPVFNLTPLQAYDCRVGPAGQPSGEIKWTPPTLTTPGQLYLTGTLYIDGSATISTGTAASTFAVQYSGMAALYLSGTMYLNGKLCATLTLAKTDCNFASYDPNSTMLTIIANGNGGQVNPGDSIQIVNNGEIQGSLFGTNGIEFGNNSFSDGPIVGSYLVFGNNVTTNSFPDIQMVPVGDPGNPPVYGQLNPPSGFSG
jgi:Tfp pilus assembly protein PilX